MALPDVALGIRQHTGHQAAHGIRDGHGGDLSAGKDKVPEGDLLIHAALDKAFVHTLVVAADQYQMVVVSLQPLCGLLPEGFSLRREVDDSAFPLSCRLLHRLQAGLQRLRHHNASVTAAVWVVVHLALFVVRIVPDLDAVDLYDAPVRRPADDALMKDRIHGIGKQGQNIYSQSAVTSPRSDAR